MSVESILDPHIVDLSTIHEIWEGLRRVTFINILIYYMGWEIIVFWERVAFKIWSLGAINVCMSSVP